MIPTNRADVVIVGAGIAGLAARRVLRTSGYRVVLLEKSRGAGGRVSTRRGDSWTADLGAQFFAKVQKSWGPILGEASLKEVMVEGDGRYPRYYHPQGMSKVAGLLLSGKEDVQFATKVVFLRPARDGWRVETEGGAEIEARSVILTPPVPQALDLVRSSGVALPDEVQAALGRLTFCRCLAAVFGATVPQPQGRPVFWKNPNPAFDGLFDQTRKGLPGPGSVLVAHASKTLTDELWDAPTATASARLEAELARISPLADLAARWELLHLHRWRYSEPQSLHPAPFLDAGLAEPLLFAGDAFGRASVDGAFASGEAAALALASRLP